MAAAYNRRMSMPDLFENDTPRGREALGPDAAILRGHALPCLPDLLPALRQVLQAAPFRTVFTPGGHAMSVKLSGCGALGWISDAQGYRYSPVRPDTGTPWPTMPDCFKALAARAAREVGFPAFEPDACLINRYVPGSRMGLHQDRDERDFSAPIVSVSLGLPAVFLFGGQARSAPALRYPLFHGDVVVWGGADRLRFHGVLPVKHGRHSVMGPQRINLTFRKAG